MAHYRQAALCFVLLPIFAGHLFGKTEKTTATNRKAALPFTSFRRIDTHLTTIDRNLKDLDAQVDEMNRLHAPIERQRAFKSLRHSATLRSLHSSSASLLAITRGLELHYEKQRQRYGIRLFRPLHLQALRMVRSQTRMASANTLVGAKSARRKFAADLLSFVLKFQAISGGYGALECTPGQWACCQPKSLKQLGEASLQGCTWICTGRLRTCRSGCLGPRTPKNARVVVNSARQNSQAR